MTGAITIRSSAESDLPAIRDLALLDGGAAPEGDALLAFVDGQLRVAVGRSDGTGGGGSVPPHAPTSWSWCAPGPAQERPRGPAVSTWLARLAPAIRGEARA